MNNAPVARRRRRWPWIVAAILLFAGFAVLAAPSIIAGTSYRDQVLAKVFAKVNGRVTAQSANWGWFSSTVLEGVTIHDPHGEPVLQVSQLVLRDKTVGGLLFYPNELGTVSIEHPRLTILADAKGLNLTEVFGRFLEKPSGASPRISTLILRNAEATFTDSAAGTSLKLAALSADIDMRTPQALSTFDLAAKLTVNDPRNFGLYQPPISISARGAVDAQADEVRLEVFSIRPEAGPLGLSATGKIMEFSKKPRLELTGDVDYDLPQLAERVRPFVGGKLQLVGEGKQQFSLAGPLGMVSTPVATAKGTPPSQSPFKLAAYQPAEPPAPAESSAVDYNIPGLPVRPVWKKPASPAPTALGMEWLTGLEGQANLSWKSAAAYGVNVGEATLQGHLAGGWLNLVASQVQIAEGEVDLRTRLHIAGSTPELIVEPGRLVHRVRITPEACAQGLKLIAPMLADATVVTGDFSLDLNDCHIPLGPGLPTMEGTLIIHSVEVGPGPMLAEVARVLRLENARIRVMTESAIYFALADNRMYHEGLEFHLGDLRVRSRGYVNLDETINLVLEVPFIDHLLPPGPLGQHLRGKAILVPVTGTLKKPKVDVKEIARVNMAALAGNGPSGAAGVLESMLGTPVNGENIGELIGGLLDRRREAREARQGELVEGVPPAPATDRPVINMLRDRLRRRLGGGQPEQPAPPPPPVPPQPAPGQQPGQPVPPKPVPPPEGPREF